MLQLPVAAAAAAVQHAHVRTSCKCCDASKSCSCSTNHDTVNVIFCSSTCRALALNCDQLLDGQPVTHRKSPCAAVSKL
jgi:hypothetical protein